MLDISLEIKLLQQQAEFLKKEFAELFELRNYMVQYDDVALTSHYLNTIGKEQFRLFCLNNELAKLKQKISLAQVYFNRNELPDWKGIEKKIEEIFRDYQKEIDAEAERLAAAKEYLKSNFLSEEDSFQLKNVYKQLVKRLHPDLHPHQTEEEKKLFLKVQAAYYLCDLKALNEILLYMKGEIDDIPEVSSGLKEYVNNLTIKINDLKAKIEQLNESFPFSYREKLQDEQWIATEKSLLEISIESIEKEIKEKNEYLLLLKSWKPELLN